MVNGAGHRDKASKTVRMATRLLHSIHQNLSKKLTQFHLALLLCHKNSYPRYRYNITLIIYKLK